MTGDNKMIDSGYYGNDRPEIFHLVEPDMLTILDVGCGNGVLGKHLKQSNTSRKVFGIEYNEDAAKVAKSNIDQVRVGDIQTISLPYDKESFDCIILADILEHLIDPGAVLQKLSVFLKKNGVFICSIPNIRHYGALLKLIRHGWIYEDYGLFDRTHLRFFSLRSMKDLILNSGLKIQSIEPRIACSTKMKILNSLMFGKLEEFIAFQYIIKAEKLSS